MNLKNQPPVFVPREYQAEIERLSKAALMDIAWDYAREFHSTSDDPDETMNRLRDRMELVQMYRKGAREEIEQEELADSI